MPSTRPNVVLILTDDQGWGDLGRSGNTQIATPNCDRLAAEGATLDRFYVQPLCAPTRAEILTGRHFPFTGVKGVSRCAERLNLDERTLGDVFRDAGYATGCFGKWHSGLQYPYHPLGRGFDEFYGFCCGHWSHYFDSRIEHNGVETVAEGYLTDALTTRAIEFMRTRGSEPFFCYLPLNTPHSPWQVPDQWYRRFADVDLPLRATDPETEDLATTRVALAMCENIDWNVGRVRTALRELGLEQDTIVVYLSDNGPNTWRWNGGMAGRKGQCREGGVRSPCSITWPGRIPAGQVIDTPAGAIDLLPTLSDLAGVPLGDTREIHGRSLKPLLSGGEAGPDWARRSLFAFEVPGYRGEFRAMSVRRDRYRGYEDGRVYDVLEDIGETRDLAAGSPELSAALQTELAVMRARLPDPVVNAVLPVGYPEFPITDLPAQDATPTGAITWSSVHPNCSWFTHWEDADDRVWWDIEVQTAGRYGVTLMYACPEDDVGSTLELSFGDQLLSGAIVEAFDPPVLAGFDRVERVESYEKPFRPLELGVIELPAGRGELVLRCTDKAGRQVAEVRSLRLQLLTDT